MNPEPRVIPASTDFYQISSADRRATVTYNNLTNVFKLVDGGGITRSFPARDCVALIELLRTFAADEGTPPAAATSVTA